MQSMVSLSVVCVAALMLCGCNQTQPVASAPPLRPAPAKFADLPAGTACAAKINRYQSVLGADEATGNVAQKVYNQVENELVEAAAACAAGRGNDALSLVHDSEVRHGYHV